MTGIDVHAGFWQALEEDGIQPAGISGTSAGSMVAAVQACGDWSPTDFAAYIGQLSDGDIRSERAFWKLRAPWIDYYLDSRPIRRQVEHLLGRFEPEIPLHIWATRQDGMLCDVAPLAPLADAVMASMAICGVFPPVEICGDEYFDGGVRANLPLPPGLAAYDEVWLLIATAAPRGYRRTSGMITRLLQNVTWLMQDQIEDTIHLAQASHPRVHILWPAFEAPRGSFRFDHSLIDKTRAWTRQWIAQHDAEILADIIAPAACAACGRDIDPNEFAGRDAAGRPLCTACEEKQAEAAKAGTEGDHR
jgi:predicted acylesterase/phospholipase RssA